MAKHWQDYRELAKTSKILVVGAGGIGCELLKNLVMSGFLDITVIDLDTIDVTNLNRQFLFHKQHVGKSKSMVAKESALSFNPDAKIEAIHDSIMKPEYGVQFFKKFLMVMNALDNRAARSHVNRMCLAADIPLVESGTAGYLGQVTVIRKKITECYECTPKPHQKSFPGCTIRNTPSEPIHCIVWSKHLFNQLFGETEPDEDVSPDAEDPEMKEEGEEEKAPGIPTDGNVARISTRQWAMDNNYDPQILFNKFFNDDINYLLTMDKLWTKRVKPIPMKWGEYPQSDQPLLNDQNVLRDQVIWTIENCAKVFESSINELSESLKKLPENDHLVWDKDDEPAMNFVAACANIRSQIFHIPRKSKFDIKSMAGNIIPAIATTNAIIAGAIVMEGIKLLCEDYDRLKSTFTLLKPNTRRQILVPMALNPPNPKCYVCASKHEVSVKLNLHKMTLKTFEEKILKDTLAMVAPDVEIDGKGVILITSEEEEMDKSNLDKVMSEFNLADGAILACDDFLQDFSMKVFLFHCDKLEDDAEFELLGDVSNVTAAATSSENGNGSAKDELNGNGTKNGSEEVKQDEAARKRKSEVPVREIEQGDNLAHPAKKAKLSAVDGNNRENDEDIICLE